MMRILIDMNLSPIWVDFFKKENIEAIYWSQVGKAYAPDTEIFAYAKENNYIIFMHDLDFGAILAATNADAPSVVQVRAQDIMPQTLGARLLKAIYQFRNALDAGALINRGRNQTTNKNTPIETIRSPASSTRQLLRQILRCKRFLHLY